VRGGSVADFCVESISDDPGVCHKPRDRSPSYFHVECACAQRVYTRVRDTSLTLGLELMKAGIFSLLEMHHSVVYTHGNSTLRTYFSTLSHF
jgi:hypothetical protein